MNCARKTVGKTGEKKKKKIVKLYRRKIFIFFFFPFLSSVNRSQSAAAAAAAADLVLDTRNNNTYYCRARTVFFFFSPSPSRPPTFHTHTHTLIGALPPRLVYAAAAAAEFSAFHATPLVVFRFVPPIVVVRVCARARRI